jgi:hypothetical protein
MEKSETRRKVTMKRPEPTWKDKPKVMFVVGLLIGVAVICVMSMGGDDGFFEEGLWDDGEDDDGGGREYTREFNLGSRSWASNGSNDYFIMEVGYQLVLEGEDDGETLELQITVLNQTRVVDGVTCRVIEEREWENGELIEVSRNWFAMDTDTNSIFYFGEEVDDYKDGVIVGHGGEWESGVGGSKGGLMMPGLVLLGSAYYQEVAPGIAMDRGVHLSLSATRETPAGTFTNCLKVGETNPVDEEVEMEYKYYAKGIGLVQDEEAKLVSYGYI